MSASREKKQRRTSGDPTLSPRAQEEQKKAERRKRNTIIYTVIGIVAVILVAALLIWTSGIIQRNQTVATIDGEKVTAPQVLYYYWNNSIISNAQVYAQIGYAWYYDVSSSPKDQIITADTAVGLGIDEEYIGKSFHEYFLDRALSTLRQEYALRAAAKEAGYTLSDAGKASVESGMANLDTSRESMMAYGYNLSRTGYLQMQYGELMNESAYRTCLENNQLATEFYDQGIAALTNYSDAELTAYYEEHKEVYDSISFYQQYFAAADYKEEDAEDEEESEEAAMAAAEEAANAVLAEVKADPMSVKDNEDFTQVTSVSSTSAFYDWVMDPDRQPGDATVLEGSTGLGYYVVVFEKRWLDERLPVDVRHILLSAMAEDDPATEDVDESKEAPTEEAFEATRKQAQELLDQWLAGEATEESFAALAEEYSVDEGSNKNGGLYEGVIPGQMISTFNDWIFDPDRKSGDTGLVQNTQSSIQGWHIMYYVGNGGEPVWKTSIREVLWAQDLENNVEIVKNEKRLNSIVD